MPIAATSPSAEIHSWSLLYRKFSGMFDIALKVKFNCKRNLFRTLVKRRRYNFGQKLFTSYVNCNLLTNICKFGRHKCETDIFFQEGRGRSRGNYTNFLVVKIYIKAVAGYSGLRHFEPDKLPRQPTILKLSDRIAAHEFALIQLS